MQMLRHTSDALAANAELCVSICIRTMPFQETPRKENHESAFNAAIDALILASGDRTAMGVRLSRRHRVAACGSTLLQHVFERAGTERAVAPIARIHLPSVDIN